MLQINLIRVPYKFPPQLYEVSGNFWRVCCFAFLSFLLSWLKKLIPFFLILRSCLFQRAWPTGASFNWSGGRFRWRRLSVSCRFPEGAHRQHCYIIKSDQWVKFPELLLFCYNIWKHCYTMLIIPIGFYISIYFYFLYFRFLIAPAQVPKISDSEGHSLTGLVGPYNEGDELTLTCLSRGGKSSF